MIAPVKEGSLIPLFGRARRDASLVVLEGFHPLKHALRFDADVREVVTPDGARLAELARALAPDVAAAIDDAGVLAAAHDAPVVLLEDPRDLGNIGACVRVAAAADVAGLLTTGSHDPWHPDALRGAAGLHFALPVARLEQIDALRARERPLLAIDPLGDPFEPAALHPRALLAFGTERHGLSEPLLELADARISIPMRAGVSSLNLATSVAALLFAWRLARPAARPR